MKRVLFGSRAAQFHFPDFRPCKDYDYLIDGVIPHKTENAEYYDCNRGVGLRQLYDAAIARDKDYILTVPQLYTLKFSHCFWNIHWSKTMHDILFFQRHGVPLDEQLFSCLYKDWTEIHGKKRAMLSKTNESFFKDNVTRKYVHDDLHWAIAYGYEPMYDKVKRDKDKATIDREMFGNLSFEDKLRLCREEIYVVALERFLIPKNFCMGIRPAYNGACRLLLTSMSKGWWPAFIASNWLHLYKPDNHNFVERFKKELERGHIRTEETVG